MDERTVGMSTPGAEEPQANGTQSGTNDGAASPSPAETAAQLEDDIENIRNHLTDVASELDRRRHRIFDIPGQVRKHARPIAVGTVALAALGLGIWWWRSRSRKTIPGRMLSVLPEGVTSGEWLDDARKRVAEAIHPEPPARPVRTGLFKISTAAAGAAASVLGKRLAMQLAKSQWPTPEERKRQTGYAS